jgi:hypothetical protein
MMKRNRIAGALAASLLVLSTLTLGADVRADQKTRIEFGGMLGRMVNLFGGKAAREGVTSTVAVKGNRKATTSGQTGQIIDLTEEKIYALDLRRKSYKVTTFAEIRRQMEEAQKRAAEEAREAGADGRSDAPATADPDQKEVEVDVDTRTTGATKVVNGFETRQVVTTITLREKGKTLDQGGGMVATADMWLAPTIAAMKEVADFDLRYAQMLYGGLWGASAEQMAAAMAMYPMLKEALGRMSAESAKVDGTAIVTTVTMDAVKSQDQIAQEAKASAESKPAAGGVGGLLGGLARRVAKVDNNDAAKPRVTFMTSTNEVLKVDTTVADADVAIPAGFKEDR